MQGYLSPRGDAEHPNIHVSQNLQKSKIINHESYKFGSTVSSGETKNCTENNRTMVRH